MYKYKVGTSSISGKGIISTSLISINEKIGCAIEIVDFKYKTNDLANFINHSNTANCILLKQPNGTYNLYAKIKINANTELTLNYNDKFAPKIIKKYVP